jgi:hypothetical protein
VDHGLGVRGARDDRQAVLGHTDNGATESYTHIQVEEAKQLVEAKWRMLVRGESM